MTPTEATDLAKRIINTWRGGPNLTEWTDTLTPLDAGRAGTTFVKLRNTHEHAPHIATFLAQYKALNTLDGGNRPDPCPYCDGTGFLVIEGKLAHRADLYGDHNGRECHCHVAAPCRHCKGAAA